MGAQLRTECPDLQRLLFLFFAYIRVASVSRRPEETFLLNPFGIEKAIPYCGGYTILPLRVGSFNLHIGGIWVVKQIAFVNAFL